jgi:hypothetical protein
MTDNATSPPQNHRDGRARRGRAGTHTRLELLAPAASPEEAAAIVAALERFMRATAPAPAPVPGEPDKWRRAAVLEAVEGWESGDPGDPWINT